MESTPLSTCGRNCSWLGICSVSGDGGQRNVPVPDPGSHKSRGMKPPSQGCGSRSFARDTGLVSPFA